MSVPTTDLSVSQQGIAIVGMAGRFPGAANTSEYWRNLVSGAEIISKLTDDQLVCPGSDPAVIRADPSSVTARGLLDKPEWFDASFFGIDPKEAEIMDPQQRIFLEEAWTALEDAGCDSARYSGTIGVFAGMSNNTYWRENVATRPDLVEAVGAGVAMMGNEKDYLATRTAYKLDLRGPALNINTACSTSLVAVCQACTALLSYQCDMALAGGISVTFPQERHPPLHEGGIGSPDGRCRALDVDAAGTVFGQGVGVVALKRYSEALADGDQIYAVIRGSAVNNDGSSKPSFTAPSVEGHAEVVVLAQALAGISPDTLGYIEAHGIGSPTADSIEIAGLTAAFRMGTDRREFCALGSVKTNIGHLDAAAGVAGLIKVALSLKHRLIPRSLHLNSPHPALKLPDTPFFVNSQVLPWQEGPHPRRAGVSALGAGGTNAHIVLEETPSGPGSSQGRPTQLLVLSARTDAALDAAALRLSEALAGDGELLPLADIAWTLQTGRRQFARRRTVICRTREEALHALGSDDGRRIHRGGPLRSNPPVAFLFPGQGSEFMGMGAAAYRTEPAFRSAMDECAELLQPEVDLDLRVLVFSRNGDSGRALRESRVAQPALFAVGYSMAQLWMSRGVQPSAMLGHGVGDYIAACIAGVLTLQDAVRLVAGRARLVQELPRSAMLAARVSEPDLDPWLRDGVSLAAVHATDLCVLAGTGEAIATLETRMREQGIDSHRMEDSHAFHSAMVEPAVEPFRELLKSIAFQPPARRFISSTSGKWITASEATSAEYWAAHLRQPVRLEAALQTLLVDDPAILLESGPGNALAQLARLHGQRKDHHLCIHSIREGADENETLSTALAELWVGGVEIDWAGTHSGERRLRVRLPTYPFERQRYWAEPRHAPAAVKEVTVNTDGDAEIHPSSETGSPLADSPAIPTRSALPITRSIPPEITRRQRGGIDELTARYTAQTAGSRTFARENASLVADPRGGNGARRGCGELLYPIVADRAEGARIWDVDGNEYIDLTMGFGESLLGHCPPFVVKAIEDQLRCGLDFGAPSPLAADAAALIRALTGMEKVALARSGSEAVAAAIRMARTVTGRSKIAVFAGEHHGGFQEIALAPQDVLIVPDGDDDVLAVLRQNAGDLAAVLVEPVQSCRPHFQMHALLHSLRDLTREIGAALIFDATVTGFRCHPGGPHASFDFRADIATYGGGIGSGLAIGAVAGDAKWLAPSVNGNESVPSADREFIAGPGLPDPLALAATRAVLTHLREHGPALQEELNARTSSLVDSLNGILSERRVPLRWSHCSSIFHLEISPALHHGDLLFHHLRLRGIHAWEGQPLFLSTAHTATDLERVATAFRESVDAMITADLLPGQIPFVPGGPAAEADSFATTPAQQEMLMAAALGDDTPAAFNSSITLHFRGPVDVPRMEVAFRDLLFRHEALRTRFPQGENGTQRVCPGDAVTLTIVDLRMEDTEVRKQRLAEWIAQESSHLFQVVDGPLVRATLLHVADNESSLIFTAHRSVCDRWSLGIVAAEMALLYTGAELPAVAQFRDYARWLSDFRGTAAGKRTEAYWVESFAESPLSLELPADFPRPAGRTFRANRCDVAVPADLASKLRQFAAEQNTTLSATLLAGFQALIHRLTSQDDIVIGTSVAGQPAMGVSHLIGHCANYLPIRAKFAGSCDFATHLAKTRVALQDAYDHQNFTLGLLLQKLNLRREPGRLPLASVAFQLDRAIPALDLGNGTTASVEFNPATHTALELSLHAVEAESGLHLYCTYDAELFGAATIDRWLDHYLTLLSSATANPATAISRLPMLSSHELKRITEDWNRTGTDYPSTATIPELFAEWVARTPDSIAVVDGTVSITYMELDRRANALAYRLRARGAKPSALIGLSTERSIRMVVGMLGILKAGAAYVPLEADQPRARLERIRKACDIVLADIEIEGEQPNAPSSPTKPESLAYVIHTSGPNGNLKGVAVSHRAIIRLVRNTDFAQLTPADTVAQASTAEYDAATFEIWGALLNGARLVITGRDLLLSAPALRDHIETHAINTLFLPTSLFHQHARGDACPFQRLKHLLVGGEPMDAPTVAKVLTNGRPARLLYCYGPAEATTFATWHEVARVDGDTVPIGIPIRNTTMFILDRHGDPVPVGVRGEIHLGGPGLADGYRSAPDLTHESFIQTRFGRLYRTGDAGRWRSDGAAEFIGRIDDQVTIGGLRFALGDVEGVLRGVSGITDCRVVIRDESDAQPRLVAYFSGTETAPPSSAALRQRLGQTLPAAMVPSAFVHLNVFPLTATGKFDVESLPAPDRESVSDPGDLHTGVPNNVEAQLLEIWEEVLQTRGVGIRDDFFALGGHSLLAARMIVRVKERLGRKLPLATIYERATIEELASVLVGEQRQRATESPLLAIQRGAQRRPFFFVHGDHAAGGLYCEALSRHIGEDRPFIAIHPHGFLPHEVPGTVEEMAASRLTRLREVQPHGPYFLGGFRAGALVAYEMARRLQVDGEQVLAVILLAPDGANLRNPVVRKMDRVMRRLSGKSATQAVLPLATLEAGAPAGPSVSEMYQSAAEDYAPGRYRGPVVLLWPRDEPPPSQKGPADGWTQVCTRVDLHLVPGTRNSAIAHEASLKTIGEHVRRVLDAADDAL